MRLMQINRCGNGGGSAAGSRRRGTTDRAEVDDRDLVLVLLVELDLFSMMLLMLLLVSWLLLMLLSRVGVTTTRGFLQRRKWHEVVSAELLGL